MRVSAQRCLPVIQISLGLFQALEALTLERGFLGVSYAGFNFAFSIRVSDTAWHCHHAVVRQHIAVQRIEGGIVDVGLEHAFTQIVEHHDTRGAAQTAKSFLVELGPDLRAGTKDQQAYRLAAVAQRHDEQPSAPVLAALLVAYHRTAAVVDLGFFARCRQNNTDGLRAVSAVQLTGRSA